MMDGTSSRWVQVTPSQYAWEAAALDTLRSMLPDADPYRVWSNFEFTDGGSIYEVDALVVTPKGVFVVEIKSWSGRVSGDQGTWIQERLDGSRQSFDNQSTLVNRKARQLASLIKRHWRGGPTAPRPPYVDSLVWFSNANLRIALPPELHHTIARAEDSQSASHIQSITQAILQIGETESARPDFRRVTAAQADELAASMARIGFKESTRTRTAGSYILQLPAFAERGATQDFMAKHKVHGLPARVRIYSTRFDATPEEVKALQDAAKREYMASKNLRIKGVVQATDLDHTDFGPAVVFEQHADAIRLDRFLAERGDELDVDARLHIIERLTSTIRAMHRRRITHRMLTPESVWLRPVSNASSDTGDGSAPVVRWEPLISDFSLAAREDTGATTVATNYTKVGSIPVVGTGAIEVVLGDPSMETYLAPEAFTDAEPDGVALDAFSIGTLTYLLFTGQPPASDRTEMRTALAGGGLSISAVLPGIDPRIEDLVRRCTNPIVSERLTSTAEILDVLALARGSEDARDDDAEVDPLRAQPGDELGGRFELKRRLGKGSTATALWCHDRLYDRDVVLKVASKPSSEERLAREAAALAGLKHENVVELFDELTLGGRKVLVLSFAGEQSLADYLRAEGSVSTDFMRRWGEDLLEAVRYLERSGVSHRDIKPENLGIVELGPRKQPHLVLFDFSLAGTSSEDLTAGTPGYLDPFLSDKGRGRFDLAAERYAAAVTLHEMATGETPIWGDGRTDPAYLPDDIQPTLLIDAIDPEIRVPLVGFLTKALQRDPAQRFDTIDDMGRAWLEVFADWEHSESAEDEPDEASSASAPRSVELPENLSLDDPVASLPTSRKVRSALRKMGAETIRQVAGLDAMKVNTTRGVAVKTRKQVLRIRAAVLDRFMEQLAGQSTRTATAEPVATTQGQGTETSAAVPGTAGVSTFPQVPPPDLDQLATVLIPPRGSRGPAGSVAEVIRGVLGLDPDEFGADWPTAAAVAERVGITRAAASQAVQKARAHWAASRDLMDVGADLLAIMGDLGGVAGVSELSAPLLDARGSGRDPADAARLARAVVRAVLDSGTPLAQLFTTRRFGLRTIVAVDGAAIAAAVGSSDQASAVGTTSGDGGVSSVLAGLDPTVVRTLAAVDAAALTDLAIELGRRADELVRAAPLVTSTEALPQLRAGLPAVSRVLSDARLLRLAGAASDNAVINAAGDLVRRDASPAEALRVSRAALVSATRLTVDELVARVAARFPTTVLPGRPELDRVIEQADLRLVWADEVQAFVPQGEGPGGVGPLTQFTTRQHTRIATNGQTVLPAPDDLDPALAEALEIDRRLDRSLARGGFLALRVPTNRLAQAQAGLARFQHADPPMTWVDLEATFLHHLRAIAAQRKVEWRNLENADDPADSNWSRLSVLTGAAIDATVEEVSDHSHVVAWYPGVLVRHAPRDQVSPLDRLIDAVLGGETRLETLWLVVLAGTTDARPRVDGAAVPIQSPDQWLDLTDTWLKNAHRAGGLSA